MNDQPPRYSVSVSGIITDDHGHALLIQRRDNHHWEPPGGVLELDETIQDGLRREVRGNRHLHQRQSRRTITQCPQTATGR